MATPSQPTPHAHLGEDVLWDFAEALAWPIARPSQEAAAGETSVLPGLAEARACATCGPRLQDAVRQLAVMRAMPEVKAPPDFLLLVQRRIEAESTFWRRLGALLGNMTMPRRAVGVPMGFASALLLVLVLVWVMPHQEGGFETQPAPSQAPASPATPPTPVLPEPSASAPVLRKKSAGRALAEKANEAKETRETAVLADRETEVWDKDQGTDQPGYEAGRSAPMPAPASVPAPSFAQAAKASESPAGMASHEGLAYSDVENDRNTDKADRSDELRAEKPLLASKAKREHDAPVANDALSVEVARLALIAKMRGFPEMRQIESGDTLLITCRNARAQTVAHWVDSLQLAPKASIQVRGDTLYLKLRP
jgi:hypothetical protein